MHVREKELRKNSLTYLIKISNMIKHYNKKVACISSKSMVWTTNNYDFG
jgi:hypothetical protein